MANLLKIDESEDIKKSSLARLFQSGYINFLIGSGASLPAINTAGNIEQKIGQLVEQKRDCEAIRAMGEFIQTVQAPMNCLINGEDTCELIQSIDLYRTCISVIERILSERRTDLLTKQANVFTTNYDLLIEQASAHSHGMKLNDGFSRLPSPNSRPEFSSANFFDRTYNSGNFYDYKVEIPSINLIKMHGSLSWRWNGNEVVYDAAAVEPCGENAEVNEIKDFLAQYAIVLPEINKFRKTTLDRIYYDLLRIFANQLDRENTLLVTFGFSFGDEHILDIVHRALKNPTLKLVIFAYNDSDTKQFSQQFDKQSNVDVIAPQTGATIDFNCFNEMLSHCAPKGCK